MQLDVFKFVQSQNILIARGFASLGIPAFRIRTGVSLFSFITILRNLFAPLLRTGNFPQFLVLLGIFIVLPVPSQGNKMCLIVLVQRIVSQSPNQFFEAGFIDAVVLFVALTLIPALLVLPALRIV